VEFRLFASSGGYLLLGWHSIGKLDRLCARGARRSFMRVFVSCARASHSPRAARTPLRIASSSSAAVSLFRRGRFSKACYGYSTLARPP
jgi:hypothetical protein